MIYLITYNTALLRNYNPLKESIKGCSSAWWHHLNNTWLINTNLNANQIYQNLSRHIQPNDRLLVIQIPNNADYQGYLPQEAWDWIKDQQFPKIKRRF
jgi:hypothetical protein